MSNLQKELTRKHDLISLTNQRIVERVNLLKLFYKSAKMNSSNEEHAGEVFRMIREEQEFKKVLDLQIKSLVELG